MTPRTLRFEKLHPLTTVAFITMLGCVLAANRLNCWTLEVAANPVRQDGKRIFPSFQMIGWPNPCISRTVHTATQFDRTLGRFVVAERTVEYDWSMRFDLSVNLLLLICLPLATAATTERLIRRWQWPLQFRLSTVFWAVSSTAIVLAAIRSEQFLCSGRGGGAIASLNPWVKVPVLIGCLCVLNVVLLLTWRVLASIRTVVFASWKRLR